MRKMPGGVFFVVAAVYLVATKPLDPITFIAVLACAAVAGLSITRYSDWAIIGGGMLIAGSLFLQSVLLYRCIDCLKADVIILAGVVALSFFEKGKHRFVCRMMASLMVVMLAGVFALNYQTTRIAEKRLAEKTLLAQNPNIYPSKIKDSGSGEKAAPENAYRYISVITSEGRRATLDTSIKPVLFYSSTCGACIKAVETLVEVDPEGKLWVPVQVKGDLSGTGFLQEKGYRGSVFSGEWPGAVPMMVTGKDGGISKTHNTEEMVKMVRGDTQPSRPEGTKW